MNYALDTRREYLSEGNTLNLCPPGFGQLRWIEKAFVDHALTLTELSDNGQHVLGITSLFTSSAVHLWGLLAKGLLRQFL